jgi:hypothetical protein
MLIGPGVGDELWNRLGRKRWIHKHGESVAHHACDWSDVAHEIETELVYDWESQIGRRLTRLIK